MIAFRKLLCVRELSHKSFSGKIIIRSKWKRKTDVLERREMLCFPHHKIRLESIVGNGILKEAGTC